MNRDQIFADAQRREEAIRNEHKNRMEKEPDDFSYEQDLNRIEGKEFFYSAMAKTWTNAKKELQETKHGH